MRLERTMKRTLSSSAGLGSALALAALLVPGIAAAAGPIPASSACTAIGTTVTCDLWAKSGTLTPPGGSAVTIWGFAEVAGGSPSVPGPVLMVNQGDDVTLTLHNTLSRPTSILFGGQAMVPDITGAPAGGTATYAFTANNPGTYLYEAGLIPGSQYQAAMGLYGALVVRPAGAPGQAYAGASTAFADEALVVLGEIDPALNGSATPWTYDLRNYAPKWFLVNGVPFSSTATPQITTTGGNTVLLRYVNAGIQHRSVGTLGLRQRVLAADGSELPFPRTMVAETVAPGQTADVLVTIPVSAATSTKYAIYDAAMVLNNNNVNVGGVYGIGGMLALVNASGTPSGTDTTGPVTSGVTVDLGTGVIQASITDAGTGSSGVGAAEYFIDSTGAGGTGTAMTGPFPADPAAVTATIPPATLAALGTGTHTINVHGKDTVSPTANWGVFSSVTFTVDKTGPTVSGLTLTPNPSNGTVSIALAGTASDAATGNSNVTQAEYTIGASGPFPMTLNNVAATVSLTATIAAGSTGVVSVHALDAAGNWGPFATITLSIDTTGPAASGIGASPNPTNGKIGVNSTTQAVRVTATLDDGSSGSTIAAGEAFIDAAGANGTGFPLVATDGTFNAVSETGYADVPLTTITLLSDGPHTIYVHGKDALGNWGPTSTLVLTVDKTAPTLTSIAGSPNPTNTTAPVYTNNTSFTLTATASDAITSVVSGEWWEGADPGVGVAAQFTGTTTPIDFVALNWAAGNHTLNARVKDSAGNWSTIATTAVTVVLPDNVFADSLGSGDTTAWTSETDTTSALTVTAGASLNGTPAFGMQTTLGGTPARYVTDATPNLDAAYHARFSFSPNGALLANNGSANGTTIFSGLNAANTAIFQVQSRRQNGGGGTYQVRLAVLRAGGTSVTSWYAISNASHRIGVSWQSAASASASLVIDGATLQTLTGLNTSANLLGAVRLGPSAGLAGGATGTLYFDDFASTRRTATELLP